MFIQTEETPNPSTLKFLPGQEVLDASKGALDFADAKEAMNSPLAQTLFGINGVQGVFLGHDFISITKSGEHDWSLLKPKLLTAIMEHFSSNRPVLNNDNDNPTGATNGNDSEIVKQICNLLDNRVRPAVAQDGGDITFHSYENGIVYLKLRGACAGCPSSTMTLKMGVEKLLKHYIPEVQEVRQVRK